MMEIVADVHIGIDVGVQITDGMVVIDMKKERREAMTNGEKLQTMFPSAEIEKDEDNVWIEIDCWTSFTKDWWNAEYIEPNCSEIPNRSTTKNDLVVDAVSRKSVITIIQNHWWNCRDIDKLVNELPAITPIRPKGHWISHIEHCKQNNLLPSGLGSYFLVF